MVVVLVECFFYQFFSNIELRDMQYVALRPGVLEVRAVSRGFYTAAALQEKKILSCFLFLFSLAFAPVRIPPFFESKNGAKKCKVYQRSLTPSQSTGRRERTKRAGIPKAEFDDKQKVLSSATSVPPSSTRCVH